MKKPPKYKVETGIEKPPRKYGRRPSINNDEELIARALEGLKIKRYRSCLQAAEQLAPKSLTYHGGKYKLIGSEETIKNRLRLKISPAYKIALRTQVTDTP